MRRIEATRLGVALGIAAGLSPWAGPASAGTPTVQEVLAEQDRSLVEQMVAWDRQVFALPDDLPLDESLRQAATRIAAEHVAHARALWPAWIAQQRAASGNPLLQGNDLSRPLYRHAINELALLSLESAGPAQDDAWMKVALAPMACRQLPPTYFARRMSMIQAAPADARPALLAGERELLSRWGTKRQDLPPRPSEADLDAADQAIGQLREGRAIAAEPMTAYLAGEVFDRDWKPGRSNRWERCTKSQWWLASQLASGKVDRKAALVLFRYSTMLDAWEFAPDAVVQKAAATHQTGGKPAFPPVAAYFDAEGSTVVQVDTDARGQVQKVQVVSRKVKVPGVVDNPPVAFESLFDAASLEYGAKASHPAGSPASRRIDLEWQLREQP